MSTFKTDYAHENDHVKDFCSHMSSFGERLREERERLGLNQDEFGEIGGVNRNSQANYEKNKRNPDSAYMAAVAQKGVDVLYVLTGQRTPRKEEGLSEREKAVLDNFRSLPEGDQASVQRLTNALKESVERMTEKEKSNTA
ncbi:MAG: helix-turn-helix domain-containing protein [Porticoccaceae bacterium]|nr:helix-turn-helix domain-containing protein [Porticoccaceae bacterium]